MSVAFVRNHTAGSSTTSDNYVISTIATAATPIGNTLIACIGVVATAGTTPYVTSIGKQAGETNSWVLILPQSAYAGGYPRQELWAITTTVPWPTGIVTATLSASNNSKVFLLSEFSGVVAAGIRDGRSMPSSGGAVSRTASAITGDLVIGVSTNGTFSSPPPDTDTLYGVWSAPYSINTTTLDIQQQYKIVTASGTQQYDATPTSGGGVLILSWVPSVAVAAGFTGWGVPA